MTPRNSVNANPELLAAVAPMTPIAVGPVAAHFLVAYDQHLGDAGEKIASQVTEEGNTMWTSLVRYFPTPSVREFTVVVTKRSPTGDGSGGATYATNPSVFFCDAQLVPQEDSDITTMLAYGMAAGTLAAAKGWPLTSVASEGLKRVLAAGFDSRYFNGGLYVTADKWLDGTRPDIVNTALAPAAETIGGAVLFLNWVLSQGGAKVTLANLCAKGNASLRAVYQSVTGNAGDPFPAFKALLDHMFPPGTPSQLATDDPFS